MRTNKLKKAINILMLIVFTSFFISCADKSRKENLSMESVGMSDKYEAVEDSRETPVPIVEQKELKSDLKIIKTASVKYKVIHVKNASKKINAIVKQFNAYVSDQRFQNDLYHKENRFTIKVPNQYFSALLDSIVQVAEFVDYENISTEDVTEEYTDLQSRLKTKLEVKKRYEEILRKRAKTVKDILAAEEKLGVIQEEIERVQGRLKYLTNKVSYSTVQVELYETVSYKEEPESYSRTFFSKIKEGFSFGWELIESIVIGIIYIWPLILLGGFIVVVVRKRLKKKK